MRPLRVLCRYRPGAVLGLLAAAAPTATGQGAPSVPPPLRFEITYTGDVFAAARGGLESRAVYLDNLDLKIRFNAARLGRPGLSGLLYVISNRGDNPSEVVGDAQGVSNIAVEPWWTLFEGWLQWNVFHSRLSVLGGLYDLNSEFDAIQAAGLFLNSSFGTGPDLSQSGANGPSIYPVAALGLRLKWRPTAWYYVEAAVLDGVPGDPAEPGGRHVHLSGEDGALVAAEVALFGHPREDAVLTPRVNVRNRSRRLGRGETAAQYASKVALGGWLYTTRTAALDGGAAVASRGAYVLAEHTLFREPHHADGLTAFARAGLARSAVNRFGSYVGGGLVYSGLLPGRHDDELGLAVAVARNGAPYRAFQADAGQATRAAELAFELTYRTQLTPIFALQPDLQWIIGPDTDPGRSNVLVFALRGEGSVRFP